MASSSSDAAEQPKSDILFIGLNQDGSSLALGTKNGYRVYQIHSQDKIELVYENTTDKDACIVERLYSSSLVAVVSLNSPRQLKVCHFTKRTEICNFSYSNSILAVRLNRVRLVVCLEEAIYIHNIRNMEVMHAMREMPPNPHGLCALVPNEENSYLAYPGSAIIGEVVIFDANHLKAVTVVPAHNSPLAHIAFDHNGTKLATASEKGTVIRVFSIPGGEKIFELRRGMKRCVTIYSLSFSPDGSLLCSSSNTETLHIFKLDQSKDNREGEDKQSWMGYLGKAITTSTNYLPTQVADVINQGRSFATVRHPFVNVKNISCITLLQNMPRLLVASADGYLYIYSFDAEDGGECTLLKQHRLEEIAVKADRSAGDAPTVAAAAASVPHRNSSSPVGTAGVSSPVTSAPQSAPPIDSDIPREQPEV